MEGFYRIRRLPPYVFAQVQALKLAGSDPRFREVGEMTGALLRYPGDRLASFVVSFGAAKISRYRIIGTKGHLTVDPGYEIWEDLVQELRIGTRTTRRTFKRRDQFAPELAYFSDCIRDDTEVEPSGLEGLNDVRIIEALLRSAERGEPVRLELEADRLRAEQYRHFRGETWLEERVDGARAGGEAGGAAELAAVVPNP